MKRFYNNILKVESGCWEWQAAKGHKGYGKCKYFGETLAHRVSFIIHHGPLLGSKMCVLHKCDNPPCVNPDHLFIGTLDDNNKDRAAKGRTVTVNQLKTHCKIGHEYDLKNTYIRSGGQRMGRKCACIRSNKVHAKKRALRE